MTTLQTVQLQVTLAEPGEGRHLDVLIEADPETPLSEVVEALGQFRPGDLWLHGHRLPNHRSGPLPSPDPRGERTIVPGEPPGEPPRHSEAPTTRLGESGIREGAVLTVGPAGGPQPRPATVGPLLHPSAQTSPWQLAVVSGPLAGGWYPLHNEMVLGRDASLPTRLDDPRASRLHARLRPATPADQLPPTLAGPPDRASMATPWVIEDLGSANGTWVDGVRIHAPALLTANAVVEIGSSVLQVRPTLPADADLHAGDDATVAFNRPARLQPAATQAQLQAPRRPTDPEPIGFPWLQAAAPLVMAGGLYAFTRSAITLLFVLLSPIMVVSNALTTRRKQHRRGAQDKATYEAQAARVRAQIDEARIREITTERDLWPDPGRVAEVAVGPTRRLWERREHDLDALVLRVGVCDRPARMVVANLESAAEAAQPARQKGTNDSGDQPPIAIPQLIAMPVVVDLKAVGVFGLAGPTATVRATARWLVAQLCVWHTPKAVQIHLLTDSDAGGDWAWLRWVPHARSDVPGAPPVFIGNDQATRDERIKTLLKLLDARIAAAGNGQTYARDQLWLPAVVVVFDGVRALRVLPGVPRLLREGPRYGIYAIGLDTDSTRLAEEGRAEMAFEADGVTASFRVDGLDPLPAVLADQVSPEWAEQVARGLSAIRDAGRDDGGSTIPNSVRFVDLVGIDLDDPTDVVRRWESGGRTTLAPVGVSIDGRFALDLKRDGPHALVAGTTGSGKSEFLQTLVASLALANRPEAINFVLVDYKGGSAFADCAELPHTVGMVSNLDGRETQRALASLDAELKRRETCLAQLRAADVDAAWEQDPAGAAHLGLARLVLVIDEFAELVHELPDFVTGLIRIARVGRSLGVHLILATQRPAGVVTGEMRANTGLRVALRMEDQADSMEVLESGEAAGITRATPGRAYARTGGGAAVVAFQSARVAGRRKGVTEGVPPPQAVPVAWERLGYPVPFRGQPEDDKPKATDLHALVGLIREATEKGGYSRGRSPWLPPLPPVLALDDIAVPTGSQDLPAVPFGVEDLPAEQAQRAALFDLVHGSHLTVAGAARSGRSTLLRTLATSLARSISPDDLHLYGLDFGNGALLPLAGLPHCGAVVLRSETDRVERLIARLIQELARRQDYLARQGFGDIAEQRAHVSPGERIPYQVVLLDRWDGFLGANPIESGSPLPAAIGRLVREGIGAGIRLVITGDRNLLNDRMTTQIEDRLVLRLADREDFRLANLNPRHIAEDMPPGRALRADSGLEVQVALLDGSDPSAAAQAAVVRTVGADAANRWPPPRHQSPLRVDTMPLAVTRADAEALVAQGRSRMPAAPSSGSLWAVLGVGGDEVEAQGADLAALGGFVVGGPSRAGRSTALATIAASLAGRGTSVVVVCPRPSPLSDLDMQPGVAVLSGSVPAADHLIAVVEAAAKPVAVVVDDADVFARSPADDALRDYVRAAGPSRVVLVVGGPIDELKTELRGIIPEARRAKAGIILSASSPFDGDLVGVRLPKALVDRMPPGRGCLAIDGACTLIQVATP